MANVTLTQKYAPKTLNQIKGQKFATAYFKAVAKKPDSAVHNYVILGPYGCGKTSLVRAFANDLLGVEDASQTPNYVELDSFQIKDREKMLALKDFIFLEVPGYKVVCFDEFHLVDPDVQAGLLKDIEDCTLPIFFFFASTESNGILDTIMSRSLSFTLSKFTHAELEVIVKEIAAQEGVELDEATLKAVVFRSFGHLRNALMQLDFAWAVGNEVYVEETSRVLYLVEQLFSAPSKTVVDSLATFPYTLVQECIDHTLHRRIIQGKELYREPAIPNIFAFYLKFKRFLKNEHDFFSFLYLFQGHLELMRKQYGI